MKKRIPTFRRQDQLLTSTEAVEAWAGQATRCNCGGPGDSNKAVTGSCDDMPAKWLGCGWNCSGQAVGYPLVYRLPSQLV
jgi:hypothetical protein